MKTFLRRHRLRLAVTAVLTGLALNVWVQDGTWPLLVVLAAVVGYLLVLGSVGYVTGSQVVKHSRREAAAIEASQRSVKGLTR
jgi:hypothetical protein